MTVVVGVDGAGRTHRLRRILASAPAGRWFTGAADLDGASLVVVDDAHRLDPATLRALTAAARAGTRLVIARPPRSPAGNWPSWTNWPRRTASRS